MAEAPQPAAATAPAIGHPEATQATPERACGDCHTCDQPTNAAPCLKACPASHQEADGHGDGPASVVLRQLEDLYQPVTLNHGLHAGMARMGSGCGVCHHNDAGNPIQPCRACHPEDGQGDDLRQPGLKGAYHRQCIACHREWSHAAACGACHLRKGEAPAAKVAQDGKHGGDMLGTAHPVIAEPDTRLYRTSYEKGPLATFHHKEHVHRFDLQCVDCHREENCGRCHDTAQRKAAAPLDHHRTCSPCHAQAIADNCDHCHGAAEKPAFQHQPPLASQHQSAACRDCHPAGKPIARLDGRCNACHTDFDHPWPLGARHASVGCGQCHPDAKPMGKVDPRCDACHAGWRDNASFDHARTGQGLSEAHRSKDVACGNCHPGRRFDRPPACADCHDDKKFPNDRPGPKVMRPVARSAR